MKLLKITQNDIDDAYMNAIKQGDLITAQQMVDTAAKQNGFTIGPVYHGTNRNFYKFRSAIGKAIWFTEDKSKIEKGESGASGISNIIPVYIKVANPAGWKEYHNLMEMQIIERYDGVHLDDDWIVFHPNQIKSANPITKFKGNIIPLSKRFDIGNDIRGDVTSI